MTGSALVPVIVPIGMVIVLAVWLALVFWADAHPVAKRDQAARDAKIITVSRDQQPAAPPPAATPLTAPPSTAPPSTAPPSTAPQPAAARHAA